MNYHMFVLIWLILFAGGSSLYGTPQSAIDRTVTITESDYTVLRIYDTDRGLPANGATSVLQDRKGYIWASTFNGLVRYDGNRVKIYDMNDVEGLGSNRFLTVTEGRNGSIYSGLEHGGLLIISEHQNEAYRIDPEIYGTNISINAIYEDDTGTLWIGTESGIFHFRNGEFEKVQSKIFDEFPVTMVQMIYRAYDTIHILFTNALVTYEPETGEYQLLALYDRNSEVLSFNGEFETSPDQKTGIFWQIHSISDDEYLLIHDDGIFQLSDRGIQTVITGKELNCTLLYGMEVSGDTYYIYGSDGVFSTENLFSNQPVFVRHNRVSVNYAITDHEGSIWLSTHAFGLVHMRETPVYQGEYFEPVSHVPITALLKGSDDVLYVGTNCDALYAFEGDQFRRYSMDEGITNHCIWSLFEQSDGTLWVGTWGEGVFFRRPGSDQFEAFRAETMHETVAVLSIFEDSGGNIWFGSYYNGLFIYDGETVKSVLNRNGRPLSAVRKIYEDRDGQIYVASDQGIGLLNDQFQIEKPEKYKLTKTLNFRTIARDPQNRLWFGSYGGGIVIADGEEIYTLSSENGLFDDTVSQLNFDDQGNLWLAGNLGVFTIENSEIESYLSGETDRVRVARLGQADGLHVLETTGGFTPSSYLSDSGELLIPSVRGLIKIETPRHKVNQMMPKIYLEELEVDGVIYRPDEIETLSYKDRRILFKFSVLSYRNPESVETEYILEGFNEQWQRATESMEAVYTTLPQGRYLLKIRGSNNDGLWNEDGTEFTFTVTPPFWLTWWFFLGIILLFFSGVYALYRYRVSRLKRSKIELENEVEKRTLELKAANDELQQLVMEKNKMQRVLGHDLRNPLSGIIGYLEILRDDEELDDQSESSEIINMLLKASRETLNLLENLLHFSGSTREAMQPVFKKSTIKQLIQEAIQIIEVQAVQKGITVDLTCERTIAAEVDQNMMLSVMRNLISNAVKFSPPGSSVEVQAGETEKNLAIHVIDSGVGMTPDKVSKLFSDLAADSQPGTLGEKGMGIGLQICKDFVGKHNGSIEVSSEPGKGSTFTVHLPKKQAD